MAARSDEERLHEMAREMGVPLYRRYNEAQAAFELGVSQSTLKRLRTDGAISYLRISDRKIAYFGYQLLEYLMESVTCPDMKTEHAIPNVPSKSETTGSRNAHTAAHGTELGLIQHPDRRGELASARRILKKRSNS